MNKLKYTYSVAVCRSVYVQCIIYCIFFSCAAHATTTSGMDTAAGQNELPLAVQGMAGIDLVASGTTISTQLSGDTTPPNVVIPGGVSVGTTALPQVALDVAGGIRAGSSMAVSACGMGQANGEGSQSLRFLLERFVVVWL